MKKLLFVLRLLSAAAVVLIIGYCCWQCIDIYLTGSQADTLPGTPIFSMPDVLQRLRNGGPLFCICTSLIVAAAVFHCLVKTAPQTFKCAADYHPGRTIPANRLSWIRCFLLITALLFILLGVMNGGLYDVLVKAINICTECIGLG